MRDSAGRALAGARVRPVQNLFDHHFEYVWLDGGASRHSPASPRSLFLTMHVDR